MWNSSAGPVLKCGHTANNAKCHQVHSPVALENSHYCANRQLFTFELRGHEAKTSCAATERLHSTIDALPHVAKPMECTSLQENVCTGFHLSHSVLLHFCFFSDVDREIEIQCAGER
jgi:hypothetical protein